MLLNWTLKNGYSVHIVIYLSAPRWTLGHIRDIQRCAGLTMVANTRLLVEGVDNERGYTCVRAGGIWDIIVPSAQFCDEPKTALKINSRSSRCGAAERNPTRNHEVAGSIPGPSLGTSICCKYSPKKKK